MSIAESDPALAGSAPCRLVLYCCRRRHSSLYKRNNLGYSPSKACLRKDEATWRQEAGVSGAFSTKPSVPCVVVTMRLHCSTHKAPTHLWWLRGTSHPESWSHRSRRCRGCQPAHPAAGEKHPLTSLIKQRFKLDWRPTKLERQMLPH